VRNIIVACLAEFVGTFMFLFFAFAGTQVANNITTHPAPDTQDPSVLILISLSFGFSLMANVWAFYRVSGGLFNPAVGEPSFRVREQETRLTELPSIVKVTLALYLVGGLAPVRACLVGIAQLLGGLAAAGLVAALFPGPLKVSTSLRPGTSVHRDSSSSCSLPQSWSSSSSCLRLRSINRPTLHPSASGLLSL
jgi:aquaporin related protein